MKELFKKIPQVSKLLDDVEIQNASRKLFHAEVKNVIEKNLLEIRMDISNGKITDLEYDCVKKRIVESLLSENEFSLRRVINGTGTVVHTNLGRSLLSKRAIDNISNVCSGYNNLEYDLEVGERGSRYSHLEATVADVLGCEAALVVNNNAAATMLAVGAFSKNKEVIVSRGELVEIGGSFRIPDIIEASNAILREVGTTNRTHIADYEKAINEETAMLLKVHPSNYSIQGFTKEVTNREIVELATKHNAEKGLELVTVEDLGSGALIDFSKYQGIKENTVTDSLKSGIDLVTFSGDKLLGGPQAGIIVGKKRLIEAIKRHPLTRAFRVCKMTIAALEATLRVYYDEKEAIKELPTLNMLFKNESSLKKDANALAKKINELGAVSRVINLDSTVGGGSLPLSKIPSYGCTVEIKGNSAQQIENKLRKNKFPIIGRIINDQYCLDVRTLLKGDAKEIVEAVKEIS